MSPSARAVWNKLTHDWIDRDTIAYHTTSYGARLRVNGAQLGISQLHDAGLIQLEFRHKDDNGLMMPFAKQFIRKSTSEEIAAHYDKVLTTKHGRYNQLAFRNLMMGKK